MKTYDLQTAREIELACRESRDASRLAERRPCRMLYRLADNKLSVDPTGDYFNPENIHSYYLDLGSVIGADVFVSKETRTLDRDTRKIFHDLVNGGSQQVGVLEARKVENREDSVSRSFVRILYRTKPNGAAHEGYILCDLNGSSSIRRRIEVEVEAFEDTPHDLINQPGYLMRNDVFLD
jgi:hypothetical protein